MFYFAFIGQFKGIELPPLMPLHALYLKSSIKTLKPVDKT